MAIEKTKNGHKLFGVSNGLKANEEKAALFYAIIPEGENRTRIQVSTRGKEAYFDKKQILSIVEHLKLLAAEMTD